MNYLNSNRLRIISQQLTSLFGTYWTKICFSKWNEITKEKQLSVRIKSAPRLSDLQLHGLTCSHPTLSLRVSVFSPLPSFTNNNNNADKLKVKWSSTSTYESQVVRGGSKTLWDRRAAGGSSGETCSCRRSCRSQVHRLARQNTSCPPCFCKCNYSCLRP